MTYKSDIFPELGKLKSDIFSSPKAANIALEESLKFFLAVISFLASKSQKAVLSCSPNWLFLLEDARSEHELEMARYLRVRLIHFLD